MSQILLIEPDKILAEIYERAIKHAGHKISTAHNAQTAIQAVDAVSPDLILLEIQLVEHSGVEFLYELRSYPEWQGIPVIIFTQVPPAEFNQSQGVLKEELGVSLIMYKPQTSIKKMLGAIVEIITVTA